MAVNEAKKVEKSVPLKVRNRRLAVVNGILKRELADENDVKMMQKFTFIYLNCIFRWKRKMSFIVKKNINKRDL